LALLSELQRACLFEAPVTSLLHEPLPGVDRCCVATVYPAALAIKPSEAAQETR
jgi:hypothetical protein